MAIRWQLSKADSQFIIKAPYHEESLPHFNAYGMFRQIDTYILCRIPSIEYWSNCAAVAQG